MTRLMLTAGVIAAVIGCSACEASEADLEMGLPVAAATAADATGTLDGWLVVRSTHGSSVRLQFQPEPLRAGATRVWIEVVEGEAEPQSIDLVSPSMPMHGITRYIVEPEPGGWSARVNVPMAGDWSIYVNLDGDSDTAEARFTVDGDPAHAGAHH